MLRSLKESLVSKLESIGNNLQTTRGRKLLLLDFLRFFKKLLLVIFLLYLIILSILLGLAGIVGERNLFFSFILFVPAQIWVFPMVGFAGLALILFQWRLALLFSFASGCYVWFYLDWEISGPNSPRGGEQLSILTFNRGERGGSLQPFKQLIQPDVVAFQEARKKAPAYLAADGYSEFKHAENIGEFTLLSKYPITGMQLLSYSVADQDPAEVGARFVIDFNGTPVAIYNIHLRTPREALKSMKRGAFLWGILGIPGTPWGEKREYYETFWDGQVEIARSLIRDIEEEKLPFIIAGDFNCPDHGYINGQFDNHFADAHEEAGHGFGYNFPGVTRNVFSFFKPWIRLDKIYSGDRFRALDCITETGRRTQHLAVGAKFELSK